MGNKHTLTGYLGPATDIDTELVDANPVEAEGTVVREDENVEEVDGSLLPKGTSLLSKTKTDETPDVSLLNGGVKKDTTSGNNGTTTVKKDTTTVSTAKPSRQEVKQTRATSLIDALAAKEEELGRPLTQQEMADWSNGKDLWAYQSINNKKGNWANSFGARDFFGKLNDDTYKMLRRDLDTRSAQKKAQDEAAKKADAKVKTIYLEDGTTKDITRGEQVSHQNFWGQGVNQNDMTPEQAQQLVGLFRASGSAIPEDIKFEGNTTLFNVLNTIGQYVDDDELEVLGYYDDNDNLVTPHKETFEEKLARRAKLEEEMKLQAQQKALARKQARMGLAELGAGIGDIIKAHGGVSISPRDYQNMYNTLTEQHQRNFDNYLARMEALKQEEKAKQKLAEERAYNEKLQQTLHDRDMEKLLKTQEFTANQANLDREHEESENAKNRALQEAIAKLNANAELQGKLSAAQISAMKEIINIPFGDNTYSFPNKNASDAAIQYLHGALSSVLLDEEGNYKPPYGSLLSSLTGDGIDSERAVRAVVSAALTSDEIQNDAALSARINKYLTQASTGNSATQVIGGGTTTGAKKKYKNKTSGAIKEWTDEEWNALEDITKQGYELVTE